ncbi:helix-turn-helix domain-containing protein [Streptomyces sp. NPDC048504]|uniref:helix-turn-helix domain-containing protein n=1 Tax=Streptomyces sp. NPDC048504 TaxID=3365559 RepID=UPI00371CD1B4
MPSEPLPAWVLTRRQAIGDNIRAARERQHPKISQEKLGELTGLDRKTVNRIEQGSYSTLLDHLLLIADALNVPLAELVR